METFRADIYSGVSFSCIENSSKGSAGPDQTERSRAQSESAVAERNPVVCTTRYR